MDPTYRIKPNGRKRRKRLDETNIEGPMEERMTENGAKRRLMLNKVEKREIRRMRLVEAAVAMFLDIEKDYRRSDIAKELGITEMALVQLTKTDEFIELYNQHFMTLGHDPRLQATQAALVDMLPQAVRELRNMLIDPDTPPTVKLNAIKEIMRLNAISTGDQKVNDSNELAEFLRNANITVNLPAQNAQGQLLPPGYKNNIEHYLEGEYTEIDQHSSKETRGVV